MTRLVGSVLLGGLTALGAAPTEATVKCSHPISAASPAVHVVDGRRVEESAARALMTPETVESIEVVCSHEGHRVFGVAPGSHLVLVFTKAADRSEMLATGMRSIVLAQEAHLAGRGSYASRLDQLLWVNPAGKLSVTLRVSEDGTRWSASGSHRAGGEPVTVSGERPSRASAR